MYTAVCSNAGQLSCGKLPLHFNKEAAKWKQDLPHRSEEACSSSKLAEKQAKMD